MTQYVLNVEGMHCAACQSRLEKVLNKTANVEKASVNLASEQAHLTLSDTDVAPAIQAIERAGFKAAVKSDESEEQNKSPWTHTRDLAILLFCAALTVPLVVPMVGLPFGYDWHLSALVQFFLATPVQLVAIWRFYPPAWAALRHGSATMDSLVALGTTAAYGLSLYVMAQDDPMAHGVYFEASAAVTSFILLGKWLESRAKQGVNHAVRGLLKLKPQTVTVIEKGVKKDIALKELQIGDHVFVGSGQVIPSDGVVVEGLSEVDESLLTGESLPVTKQENSAVIGGSLNGSGVLTIRVEAIGAETMLSKIITLIEETQASKAPIQKKVDQISAVFVPVVIAISLVTLGGWLAYGVSMDMAVLNAISVLVIACPCALGLATPTALIAGTGTAAKHGVLIRNAECLEKGTHIKHVVFDKTGTLTKGKMTLQETHGQTDSLIFAQALQANSHHPIAVAFKTDKSLPSVTVFKNQVGQGVEGTIEGQRYRLGKASYMQQDTSAFDDALAALSQRRLTPVFLENEQSVLALFGIGDEIMDESPRVIQLLHSKGISATLLSGDAVPTAQAVGEAVGVAHVAANKSPLEKVEYVKSLHDRYPQGVAMVGDGMNDAAALNAADLGIAMGQGSDIALQNADIILMRQNPLLVAHALDIATKTYAKINQNLFWAFIYNAMALPAAAFGYLNPVLAGAAMAFSSVSVVGNALLLKRWKP